MSKPTGNNSILILATLGVYFGLMLAGSPVSAFANPAATTRYFDIGEEIEFAERLDTDPDDLFAEALVGLVKELADLPTAKQAGSTASYHIEDLDLNGPQPSYMASGVIDAPRQKLLDDRTYNIARALHKEASRIGVTELGRSKFVYQLNDGLNLEITLQARTASHAASLAEAIDAYLNTVSRDVRSRPKQLIKANSSSKVDDTKVIISIHLARSDIDDILA